MRVLIFGDSIGQGFYDDIDGGWAQILQKSYFSEKIAGKSDVNILNLSISGDTSTKVLARLEQEIASRDNGEDLVIILAIGVNDSYEKNGKRCTSEEEFEQNILKLIKLVKQHGRILVIGCTSCVESRVQPTAWNDTLYYSNKLLEAYEQILSESVKKEGEKFLPLWKASYEKQQIEETMPDGLHPNNIGHKLIAELVRPELEALLT